MTPLLKALKQYLNQNKIKTLPGQGATPKANTPFLTIEHTPDTHTDLYIHEGQIILSPWRAPHYYPPIDLASPQALQQLINHLTK